MKILFTAIAVITISLTAYTQCDVQKMNRADGTTVRYIKPDRVGISENMMLSLSVQTNGSKYFVMVLSVFQKSAVNLKGKLKIQLDNSKSVILDHFTSQATSFGKFPATNSVFPLSDTDLPLIAAADITVVTLQLESGEEITITPMANADILKKQYNCLK